jgi:hypothetical protein
MLTFLGKLIALVPLLTGNILGIVQAAIKVLKELITSVINLVFPFTPDSGKFEDFVLKVRDLVNKLDEWVETGKKWLLKIAGLDL